MSSTRQTCCVSMGWMPSNSSTNSSTTLLNSSEMVISEGWLSSCVLFLDGESEIRVHG